MKTLLVSLLLALPTSAFAARPTIGSQPFPNDYRPSPCAPEDACASLTPTGIVDVASTMLGYSIAQEWVDARWNEMISAIRPACAKLGTCIATRPNTVAFCVDLLKPEIWGTCDRHPAGSADYDHCAALTRVFTMLLRDEKMGQKPRECAAAQPAPSGDAPMTAWIAPETIGSDYAGIFTVYALDPETRIPIMALVSMESQKLTTKASPGGKPWTNYQIEWPVKLLRIPNAAGHTDLVPPSITVSAPGFTPVTMKMPVVARTVIVEMSPKAEKLKPGKNTVMFTARDAATGEPVELRVMLGETVLGDTNRPLDLELKKGAKRPEIWATSLFNQYSDVVIAPAE